MAGLDFNVTQNLKLELGYRYLDYGKFKSGASNCFNGTGGQRRLQRRQLRRLGELPVDQGHGLFKTSASACAGPSPIRRSTRPSPPRSFANTEPSISFTSFRGAGSQLRRRDAFERRASWQFAFRVPRRGGLKARGRNFRMRPSGGPHARKAFEGGVMSDVPAKTREPLGSVLEQSDSAAVADRADVRGPFGGRPPRGRRDFADDPDLRALGLALIPLTLAARANFRRDLGGAAAALVFVIAMGALGFTAFNALFYTAAHRTSALNLSIIQGAIPAFVLIGARLVFRRPDRSLAGFRHFHHHDRRRRHRRAGRYRQTARAGLQRRRHDDVARVHFLRRLHGRPARPSADLRPRFFRRDGRRRFRHFDPLLVIEIAAGGFIWPTLKGLAFCSMPRCCRR